MTQIIVAKLPPLCAKLTSRPQPLTGKSLGPIIEGEAHSAALRVGLLNLMPTKEVTERQWLRLIALAAPSIPVESIGLTWFKLANWQSTHSDPLHMARYYRSIDTLWRQPDTQKNIDVMVMTGAPLGQLDYQQVGYWQQLQTIMQHLNAAKIATLYSCWAAQAALFTQHQVATVRRQRKVSGVFLQHLDMPSFEAGVSQQITQQLRQQSIPLVMPHSRFAQPATELLDALIANPRHPLQGLLRTVDDTCSCLFDEATGNMFWLGHPEYEAETLALEFERDQRLSPATKPPTNQAATLGYSDYQSDELAGIWQATGANMLASWLTAVTRR